MALELAIIAKQITTMYQFKTLTFIISQFFDQDSEHDLVRSSGQSLDRVSAGPHFHLEARMVMNLPKLSQVPSHEFDLRSKKTINYCQSEGKQT